MSSELTYLARLNSIATKELKISAVEVFGSPSEVESQLVLGYSRKGMAFYNNSNAASGEVVWGNSDVTAATGMPIPKGCLFDIPVSVDIPVYVMNTVSGEISNLRVIEIA
uniref:Uncharacterized protein n=1 Tax=viral metagenome TaxID=1070528 RepID=A0A6M3IY02_9ZZZZ